jgi:hypothetical protein
MADTLALDHLYTAVKARFATEAPTVDFRFGWREPSKQQSAIARVVFVPGDPSGNAGKVGPAKFPGRNPRPLATFNELFHIVVSASDLTAPESEIAQYRVVRALRDAVHCAMYRAAHGTFTIDSETWNLDLQNERRFGATLVMQCTIQAMVADQAFEGVPVGTSARVEVTELDVTETQDISAADEP